MNPLEFGWTDSQLITVKNPNPEDFVWKVHGKEYKLRAGKAAEMPGYIAWVYVYNQAALKVQAEKKFDRWNEEEVRKEYYDKFVSGIKPLVSEVEEEPSPINELDDGDEEEEDGKPITGQQSLDGAAAKKKKLEKQPTPTP